MSAGTTVATFVAWLLGVLAWHAPSDAESAAQAVSAVPLPVLGMVYLLIGVGGVFLGGWWAKHTPRPQPEVDDYAEQLQLARRDPSDVAVRAQVEPKEQL